MSKFYCILSKLDDDKDTIRQLENACKKRDIEFVKLGSDQIATHELPVLEEESILYRLGVSARASLLERLLYRPNLKTFYSTPTSVYEQGSIDSIIRMQKCGIAMPRTVLYPSDKQDVLEDQVRSVGGFPVVFKLGGFMHGEGVEKYDDIESLVARVNVAGYKNSMLKEYIDYVSHMRLIVVGEDVVDSVEYQKPDDDFRTNAHENIEVKVKNCSDEINQLAVSAVHAHDVEFGGVDILIDSSGAGFVAEVNTPCYFARASNASGIDVAGQLVDYLSSK